MMQSTLSTGIAGSGARTFLQWDKITKITTSLVIPVPPTDAPDHIKNGILLFNRIRAVRALWPSTPPPSALSAGASATDAQKSTTNAAVTHRPQPKPAQAPNASQSQPSRRGSTASARTPPPNASILALTTQPTLPLVRSVYLEALAEQRTRANKLVRGSPPSYAMLPARQYARGSLPEEGGESPCLRFTLRHRVDM